MNPLDIAVAGCGPAGLAAALALSRDGHRVALFERFDTPRPLGSGLMLQPTGLAVLAQLGLAERMQAHGARIERIHGVTPSGRPVLDVRYAALPGAFGLGVHRAALFATLFEAVQGERIGIETGRTLVDAPLASAGRRRLAFADGTQTGPFDLVVDALGAASPLAPPTGVDLAYGALWASLDWPPSGFDSAALAQRYVGAHTMCGVMPIGRIAPGGPPQAAFFWSLRRDRLDAWRQEGLAAWKAKVAALWPQTQPLLDEIAEPDRLTFARYRHRTLSAPTAPGVIHIGDAWRSTSPQLGQGVNMALLDAYALALALREAPDVAAALARAVRLRRAHVALYQAMSRLFTPVYQSDSVLLPWLRDEIAGPVSRTWPVTKLLAAMVCGLVGSPLGKLGLSAKAGGTPALR